ncbi:MAG: DUF4837 family protein [candidate division WOR-3 bacterium]
MQKITFLLVLFIFLFCSRLPQSVGKSRDVVIVGSQIDTTFVAQSLQIYNYMPQREPTFIFIFASDTILKRVKLFHSLFLCGSLQEEFILTLLNAEARNATIRDTFNLFKVNDLWAKDQVVIILAAKEPRYIPLGLQKYQKIITKIFEENYYRKIKKQYYETKIDQRIKRYLKRLGIEMDFTPGWLIDSTFANENFIFIHAHYPDRSIFIYREKKTFELNDSTVIAKRDELTKRYYNGDYILKELTFIDSIEFQNMRGFRVKGVWQNDSLVAGGPFLSYFLVKEDTLYVIDGMLFLPGERKTDFFATIEVIMNSFKILATGLTKD